jgi:hypothetical protein
MLDERFQRLHKVIAVRIPRPDVTGRELEDTETKIAREHRVFFANLVPSTPQALLGQFSDGARFTKLVT